MTTEGHGLDEGDRHAIVEAVRAVESRTSGEIVCVVARRADSHIAVAGFLYSAFVIPATFLATLVARWLWVDLDGLAVAAAALVAWLLGLAVLATVPAARRALTPRSLRRLRASAAAAVQFRAARIHSTRARTGVMIYVALEERHAEILADGPVEAGVPQQEWQRIVDALVADAAARRLGPGLVAAIEAVGLHLERLAPRDRNDVNELPDHVILI